ncbi:MULTISPECIES: winged helix-turn-helix domain-containing protein [Leptospira]|uniref:winged helix-turn-helix domain-containing protein n=1 Tax=Leptospira TaxID=171 RepID=UPI0009ACE450|nr:MULTISPECIES: winged helix-turn-helix domain-containing protein [Leptospira]UML79124.1 winged helix-turn-helix domain-containing protein [Leptospira kirschneri]UML80385.1 winged helix-turn-helix domain-containing protein [Leptospira kirschneri]UMQ54079.1 winged helix-turn-helix domain-containing protein [Leptospira interrogans]
MIKYYDRGSKILNSFLKRPNRDRSTSELSRMLSIPLRSVSYHLRKMSAAGILIPSGIGRGRRYKLNIKRDNK